MGTDRIQINFRLEKELAEKLDQRRVDLRKEMGKIPTRSAVFIIALTQYLQNPQPAPIQEVKLTKHAKK